MARLKKRKLCWKASGSSQVVGYRLYWSEGRGVNYDSSCEMLGNVTEIILPDGVASFNPGSGPVTFGVTAVDELGNESDMITLAAPYQFSVPKAPDDLHLKTVNAFYTSDIHQSESAGTEKISHTPPAEPMAAGGRIRHEQPVRGADLSTNLKLIEKQALAF